MTTKKREPRRLIERDDLEGAEADVAALISQVEAPRIHANARARVWSRLDAPKPAKRPWMLAAFGGAATAAVIVLAVRALAPAPSGSIEVLEGPARFDRLAASSSDRVQTKSHSRVRVAGMVIADLAPDTEIIAASAEDRLAIELLQGGITIEPLAGHTPKLRISTKPYVLEGTASARVRRLGTSDVAIEVLTGEATLTGPSGTHHLAAGDKFDSTAIAALEPPTTIPVPVPAPVPTPTPTPTPVRRAKRSKPPRVADAPPDWSALYQRAIREPDPIRAIPLFDRLATSHTEWSEISALQSARLEMRRGRCSAAISRFDSLLGGTFDPEVRLDIIECQLSLGELRAAERSVDAFLRAHPNSEREAELRFLRADLSRKRGRCADAITDYEAAVSSLSARHADDALYFSAWCKLQIGQTAEGLTTLRRYLDRFPSGRHAEEAKKKL